MLLPPSTQPDDDSGDERKGKHNVAPVVVGKGTTVRGQVRRIQPSPSELNTEVKNNIGKLCVCVFHLTKLATAAANTPQRVELLNWSLSKVNWLPHAKCMVNSDDRAQLYPRKPLTEWSLTGRGNKPLFHIQQPALVVVVVMAVSGTGKVDNERHETTLRDEGRMKAIPCLEVSDSVKMSERLLKHTRTVKAE